MLAYPDHGHQHQRGNSHAQAHRPPGPLTAGPPESPTRHTSDGAVSAGAAGAQLAAGPRQRGQQPPSLRAATQWPLSSSRRQPERRRQGHWQGAAGPLARAGHASESLNGFNPRRLLASPERRIKPSCVCGASRNRETWSLGVLESKSHWHVVTPACAQHSAESDLSLESPRGVAARLNSVRPLSRSMPCKSSECARRRRLPCTQPAHGHSRGAGSSRHEAAQRRGNLTRYRGGRRGYRRGCGRGAVRMFALVPADETACGRSAAARRAPGSKGVNRDDGASVLHMRLRAVHARGQCARASAQARTPHKPPRSGPAAAGTSCCR